MLRFQNSTSETVADVGKGHKVHVERKSTLPLEDVLMAS